MSLASLERPRWAQRLSPTHALWLGPQGLFDFGALPGWRLWPATGRSAATTSRHADFAAWCRAHPGRGCNLVLSGWLLHEMLLDADLPLPDDAARLGHARNLWMHHHGEVALQWPLTAWQAAGRHGVSALHATSLPALQGSARRNGVALRAVRPWWSLALALALQQLPGLVRSGAARLLVVDGRLVTQVDLLSGRLTGLQQRRLARASLAALPAPEPRMLCAAVGHGLSEGDADDEPAPGIHLLGNLRRNAPSAPWCSPAAAA